MKTYNSSITLTKNFRGVYDIDTSKGCFNGLKNNKNGCYNECYAAKYAKVYGFDFSKTMLRKFDSIEHLGLIREQIHNIDMPFIRVGTCGDPSENWEHTIKIINLISGIKPIVLITKHWNLLTNCQLNKLSRFDIVVNTSISALDESMLFNTRLKQYFRLTNYCKSVLRVVSCDFNTTNLTGLICNDVQEKLFNNKFVIDNVLRVSKNNALLKMGLIKATKEKFLSTDVYFSKKNKNTHTGMCKNCPDMCGLSLKNLC